MMDEVMSKASKQGLSFLTADQDCKIVIVPILKRAARAVIVQCGLGISETVPERHKRLDRSTSGGDWRLCWLSVI